MLGFPADVSLDIASPSDAVPTSITEKDAAQLIDEAVARRHDVISSKAALRVKEAAVTAANSGLWPTVNLGGTAETNKYSYPGGPKYGSSDRSYSAYATVNWDVFDGFNKINIKRQAEADAAGEYEKLIEIELQVSGDVWSSYHNFSAAVTKLRFSRSFLHTASASYELALEGYNVGVKSILDLLNAQSQLSQASSQLIQSEKNVFVALANLAHSTGSLYPARKDEVSIGVNQKEKIVYE